MAKTVCYGPHKFIMTVKTLQQYFNEITRYNFYTPSLYRTPTSYYIHIPTGYIYNKLDMDPIVHN